jgi:hypothetical protein
VARSWRRTDSLPSICWTRNWRSFTPSRSSKTKSCRMAECSRGRVGEGVFRLLRGRPWLGAGGGEECLTEGERHVGVQEVSTTAKQSRAGVGEPEGEEEVRGRRGCQGEPLRGRNRCRGMVKLGVCRKSAEPRWKMRNARKTMKTTEPSRNQTARR